jgi:hypothetical protein
MSLAKVVKELLPKKIGGGTTSIEIVIGDDTGVQIIPYF